jgi:hypothetical protein
MNASLKECPLLRFMWSLPSPGLSLSPNGIPSWALLSARGRSVALRGAVASAALALLAGCVTPQGKVFGVQEDFGSVATYSRMYDATPQQTCEAARRALLSQGYIVVTHNPELVEGKKSFQPEADSHLQMVVRVVCVPESADGKVSLGFVTALQDTYALRKTNNSASLGVGGIGSVSLPVMSSSEAMVKVGSQTIAKASFYDGFFDLVKRYLAFADEQGPSDTSSLGEDSGGAGSN